MSLEFTNDPNRRSFVEVEPNAHFPIQNLPFGVCETASNSQAVCCSAIGDFIVDLAALERHQLLPRVGDGPIFNRPCLNAFAALGRDAWRSIRHALSELLDSENSKLRDNAQLRQQVLFHKDQVTMRLPMEIGDYTDFYSSKEHATNVGIMFRGPDNALQPNWLHLPVAYHGRSSSVVLSDTPIRRPHGQLLAAGEESPSFGASRAMDFELEMGFFVGPGSELGTGIPIDQAHEHIFGMTLVNDWSARDIQRWEYVPLGPFLGKNFATSIAPWIITLDALTPFQCTPPTQDPQPLEYLRLANDFTFDIQLEVHLKTASSSEDNVICQSNFKHLYWSMAQQLAHHSCNGCNMQPGDLLASGTISGSSPSAYGSMLELAWKGEKPLPLTDGQSRSMLADGDTVQMTGWAQGEGYRIGFGEVSGEIHS